MGRSLIWRIARLCSTIRLLWAPHLSLRSQLLAGVPAPRRIESPDQLWEALLRGDDLVTEIPPDRWDADEYYDPEPGVPGRSVSKLGAFLVDVAGFDPEFFGISEREATTIDPQHRLLLETSWEAVEHAGGGGLPGDHRHGRRLMWPAN